MLFYILKIHIKYLYILLFKYMLIYVDTYACIYYVVIYFAKHKVALFFHGLILLLCIVLNFTMKMSSNCKRYLAY